jgi:hypothetical protein
VQGVRRSRRDGSVHAEALGRVDVGARAAQPEGVYDERVGIEREGSRLPGRPDVLANVSVQF